MPVWCSSATGSGSTGPWPVPAAVAGGTGRAHGTPERYVREWLAAQAASGYVDLRPGHRDVSAPPEQAVALADERAPRRRRRVSTGPGRAARCPRSVTRSGPATGSAGTNTTDLFVGTERFFGRDTKPVELLASRAGRRRETAAGAAVADVGCGHGGSTVLMAKALPEIAVRRLRLPRGLDRTRAPPSRDARPADRMQLRGRPRRRIIPGSGYRPRHLLRLPARHGRSDRGGGARPQHAQTAMERG